MLVADQRAPQAEMGQFRRLGVRPTKKCQRAATSFDNPGGMQPVQGVEHRGRRDAGLIDAELTAAVRRGRRRLALRIRLIDRSGDVREVQHAAYDDDPTSHRDHTVNSEIVPVLSP